MNIILYTLLVTHITVACITIYLHRGLAHRGLGFHPALAHVMRFWLWLTAAADAKHWVTVHRVHHRFSDSIGDPHSPHMHGIWQIVFKGWLNHNNHHVMMKQYSTGTPDDWIERNFYSPYRHYGILLMLCIDLLLYGSWGFPMWCVQMIWIPFWAAGVINGIGHWWGYRNGETKDKSKNIFPIGILIGGEELHNNHHLNASNPKFSRKWWEFDIAWLYIKIFERLGLITIRQTQNFNV